jgi:glycosyltransferase involved in cell wall biosynthesis
MRVAHVSTVHQALDVRVFRKECRTLARAGHDVHLLAARPPEAPIDGVTFHEINAPRDVGRMRRLWIRQWSALRACRRVSADLYHFHDPELIPLGLLLKLGGARVVYDVHEDTPREARTLYRDRPSFALLLSAVWLLLEAVAKRTLDAFVCATPTIAANFPAERTIIAHNFPLVEEFPPELDEDRKMSGGILLIYAGVITAARGIREMVRAVGLLPGTVDVTLVLLGEFASPELEAETRDLAGWKAVRFLGWQPRDRLLEELAAAHVGLVLFHPEPDHMDALPNKLFEYMAAGLAIVASDFPLWRSILARTRAGVTASALEPAAIAGRLLELIQDPASVAAMGRAGREAVRSELNWEPEGRRLVALYARLAAG